MNRKLSQLPGAISIAAFLFLTANLSFGQTKATTPGTKAGSATFTVTVVGKKEAAPPLVLDDVQLFTGKERKQIGDWKKGEKLFLAILIDDSLDSGAAGQWDYLKEFIMAQPPSTYIAVGYIRNNMTMVAQDFTENHELAAKALRIPIGLGGIGSSPYLGTMDMLKRWPEAGLRRSVILISSGIDYFRGPNYGTFSPDLDPLIQRSERQNTNVWTIYYPTSSHRGRSFYQVNNAQNNLEKLADNSGAEAYYLGASAPVSLKPYFDEIATHLNNQYLLTFAGSEGEKGRYQPVKVKTEIKDVELFTPAAVYIPGTK
jgi:hypothetical protein